MRRESDVVADDKVCVFPNREFREVTFLHGNPAAAEHFKHTFAVTREDAALLLIVRNLSEMGMFRNIHRDLTAAAGDIAAILAGAEG